MRLEFQREQRGGDFHVLLHKDGTVIAESTLQSTTVEKLATIPTLVQARESPRSNEACNTWAGVGGSLTNALGQQRPEKPSVLEYFWNQRLVPHRVLLDTRSTATAPSELTLGQLPWEMLVLPLDQTVAREDCALFSPSRPAERGSAQKGRGGKKQPSRNEPAEADPSTPAIANSTRTTYPGAWQLQRMGGDKKAVELPLRSRLRVLILVGEHNVDGSADDLVQAIRDNPEWTDHCEVVVAGPERATSKIPNHRTVEDTSSLRQLCHEATSDEQASDPSAASLAHGFDVVCYFGNGEPSGSFGYDLILRTDWKLSTTVLLECLQLNPPRVLLLASCSLHHAAAVPFLDHVQHVIGFTGKIDLPDAKEAAKAILQSLLRTQRVGTAVQRGRERLIGSSQSGKENGCEWILSHWSNCEDDRPFVSRNELEIARLWDDLRRLPMYQSHTISEAPLFGVNRDKWRYVQLKLQRHKKNTPASRDRDSDPSTPYNEPFRESADVEEVEIEGLDLKDRPRLIQQGAGYGKSTLLRYFAWRELVKKGGSANEDWEPIPVFVPLAEWHAHNQNQGSELSFTGFLANRVVRVRAGREQRVAATGKEVKLNEEQHKRIKGLYDALEAAAANGKLLFLLDGLDELVHACGGNDDEVRQTLGRHLQATQSCGVVVAGRIGHDGALPEDWVEGRSLRWEYLEIKPSIDPEDRTQFLESELEQGVRSDELLQHIESCPELNRAATSAFVLCLSAYAWKHCKEAPATQPFSTLHLLYQAAASHMLNRAIQELPKRGSANAKDPFAMVRIKEAWERLLEDLSWAHLKRQSVIDDSINSWRDDHVVFNELARWYDTVLPHSERSIRAAKQRAHARAVLVTRASHSTHYPLSREWMRGAVQGWLASEGVPNIRPDKVETALQCLVKTRLVSVGNSSWEFIHRSFAEYFVAGWLDRFESDVLLEALAKKAVWKEEWTVALRFYCERKRARTGQAEPTRLGTLLTKEHESGLRVLNEPQDTKPVDWARVANLLGWIGDPRIKPDHRWVSVPAGREFMVGDEDTNTGKRRRSLYGFEIHRWPVTAGEYGEFLRAFREHEEKHEFGRGSSCADFLGTQLNWWERIATLIKPHTHCERGPPRAPLGLDPEDVKSLRNWLKYPEISLRLADFHEVAPNHPMVGVSWIAACAYCLWMSMPDKHQLVRLPLEDEWECAARGDAWGGVMAEHAGEGSHEIPTRTDHPWCGEIDLWHANYGGCRAKKNEEAPKPLGRTSPVGVYYKGHSLIASQPLFDLTGNVWEWTSDEYLANRRKTQAHRKRVMTAREMEQSPRVLRGGSWYDDAGLARVSLRIRLGAGSRTVYIGFRPVRVSTV